MPHSDPEKAKACRKRWKANNRAKVNQHKNVYRAKNKDKLKEKQREWRANNKAKVKAQVNIKCKIHSFRKKISWLSFVQYSCKNHRLKANFVNYFLRNKLFSSAASVWVKLCHIKSIFCTSRRSDMSLLIRAAVQPTSRKSRGIVWATL